MGVSRKLGRWFLGRTADGRTEVGGAIVRGMISCAILGATVLSFNLIAAVPSGAAGSLSNWLAMDGNIRFVSGSGGTVGWANDGATGGTACPTSNPSGQIHVTGANGLFDCGAPAPDGVTTPPIGTAPAFPPANLTPSSGILSQAFLTDQFASQTYPGCNAGNDFTVFANGQKYGALSSYSIPSSSGPNSKTDLTNVQLVTHQQTGPNGDKELYFGIERLNNNGDVAADIEFLQGGAHPTGTCAGGGTLQMPRTQGDFAIEFNFTVGGTIPTPVIDKWQCNAGGGPAQPPGTLCDPESPPAGDVPGYVSDTSLGTNIVKLAENIGGSSGGVTYPGNIPCGGWVCAGTGTTNQVLQDDFVEGGIDLTALAATPFGTNLGCASSVVAESHTAQNNSDDLKDFVSGNFSTCPSTTTTQQSLNTSGPGTIQIGGGVWHDVATVDGNATAGAPTGTVSFYECGPTSAAANCAAIPANKLGSDVTLTQIGTTNNSSAPSANVPIPTALGTYCFSAVYNPATSSGYSSSSDNTTGQPIDSNECVTVGPATPTNVTTINPPTDTSVGNTWTDSATITGNTAGGAPTGSVAFTWCKESAPSTPCTGTTGGGSAGSVSTPTVVGDASTFGPSNGVTPTTVGTYCFTADYTATTGGNYNSVPAQSDTECFTVTPATPGFITTIRPRLARRPPPRSATPGTTPPR